MDKDLMISVRGASKKLPSGQTLLREINLDVPAGTTTAILGRSGCGKSTLLGLLGLMDTFDSGDFLVSGVDVSKTRIAERDRLRGEKLGFIFQRFCLIPYLNALENVEAPLSYRRDVNRSARRKRAYKLLGSVGMHGHARKYPRQLSGGEQQRVAIARSLINFPPLILADEPTGALDTRTADVVLSVLLEQVHRYNAALVLVTHDAEIASKSDRCFELTDGTLKSV